MPERYADRAGRRRPVAWPPPLSFDQVRARSPEVLPGCEVRRVPYFRYALTWSRPAAGARS